MITPTDVLCPICRAKAGHPCLYGSGLARHGNPHKARISRAEKAMLAPALDHEQQAAGIWKAPS